MYVTTTPAISEITGLTCGSAQLVKPEKYTLSLKKEKHTANSEVLRSFSKEEIVHEETEEQERQDPVDWVDVEDDQADVKEPDAHVGEVQSIQCETSMGKMPVSPCPSLLP